MPTVLGTAARTAKRITRDVPHRLGLAVLADDLWWAAAVVRTTNGEVVAWDGWYPEEDIPTSESLDKLGWDEWDDMPSKLLVIPNAEWLAGPMALEIMPSYSFSVVAAEICHAHADAPAGVDQSRRLRSAPVVAYFPIQDTASFVATLRRYREHASVAASPRPVVDRLIAEYST